MESIRSLSRRRATVRVLVTVKASPQPSTAYGDTVCVAGTLLDGPPRWIRLYPVPFRYLEGNSQFAKYDIIEVQFCLRRPMTSARRAQRSTRKASGFSSTWIVGPLVPRMSRGYPRRRCVACGGTLR